MRKLLTILAISTLLITNCKKADIRENSNTNNQEVNDAKLRALQKMDIEEKKVAYQLLNESERSTFWKSIVNSFMNDNRSLGIEATVLLNDLKSHIRPEIFKSNSDENAFFKDYFVTHWLENAERLLSPESITELAYKPGSKSTIRNNNLKTSPEVSTACACNIGSRFDCVKSQVHLGTDGFSYTETRGACVNSASGGCQSSTVGCGFIWLYSCNGNNCVF